MKKTMIWILALCILLAISAVIFYRYYAPKMMAAAIVQEELPAYLPSGIQQKVKKYREPINAAAHDIVVQLREKEISIEKLTAAIDDITEDDLNAISNDLKSSQPKTADEAFNIVKNHFQTNFDVEVLRAPFKNHVNDKMIQKAMNQLEQKTTDPDFDLTLFKSIAKTILIQKEAQLSGKDKEAR